jgi:hypothetical protein
MELVQFCKKRGRINSPEGCLDKAHSRCNDYVEVEMSVPIDFRSNMSSSNIIGETLPAFDEYRRMYRFIGGSEMTFEAYWALRNELRAKAEKRNRIANSEYAMKCMEATDLINDMMAGYAPSIAYSRAFRRKNKGG